MRKTCTSSWGERNCQITRGIEEGNSDRTMNASYKPTGRMIKWSRLVLMVALLLAAAIAAAYQSNDRISSTPLKSNLIKGAGTGKKVEYYYSFTAGQGEVSVTVDLKATSGSTGAEIEIFNRDGAKNFYYYPNAISTTERTAKSFVNPSRQLLILRLQFDRSAGDYQIKLGGAVELAQTTQCGAVLPDGVGCNASCVPHITNIEKFLETCPGSDLATSTILSDFEIRSRTGEFALDSNNPVDKTLVLMSNTGGATWKSLGYVNKAKWRMGVVPLGDELGFGVGNALLLGNLGPNGKYVFDAEANPASNEPSTWETDFSANKNVPLDRIYANMWAHPILTRTPDAKSYLLAFPDVIGKSSGFGYRLYWYDRGMQLLTAKDSVMSANPSPDNVIFHLTAIDPGKGPVLFYWYDLDSAAEQGTIRGRLIADGAS